MFMTSASGLNPQWRKNILWNKSKHVKNNKNKLNKWNIAKIWSQIDEVIKGVSGVCIPDGAHIVAAVGQEHRLGRWWRMKEARNSIAIIPLNPRKSEDK